MLSHHDPARANRGDMDNALRFLQLQIALYETQLHAMEERRAAFRTKYAGLLPADGATVSTASGSARDAVNRAQVSLHDAQCPSEDFA